MATRPHSSLLSLSWPILSRFVVSCSSQRSSSTKLSTHCKELLSMRNKSMYLPPHLFSAFCAVKHHICWWPSYLHVKKKLEWPWDVGPCLNSPPDFFAFWWGTFLMNNQHPSQQSWWIRLTLTTMAHINPPYHDMWKHVHQDSLNQSAVVCCKFQ